MLSILLVLNHHFCSVPNNLSFSFPPSIYSSTIYHFLSLLLIAMCRPNRPHFAPSKGIKSFSIFIYHRRHRSLSSLRVGRWCRCRKMMSERDKKDRKKYINRYISNSIHSMFIFFLSSVRFFPLILFHFCSFIP